MFIVADKLSKTYNSNGVETKALKEASFSIDEGSFTIILGPSGAGKTTLLNLLGGMDQISSGSLIVGDTKLVGLNKKELTLYRRNKVGFVFQFYNLMPNLTALENVELAVEVCSNHLDPFNVIKSVGLEERANNFPSQLSGGEQQRVAIARAIAKNPKILLCDEPTGALDYKTGKQILSLLEKQSRVYHITVIIITHNSAIAPMADKVIKFKNGKVEDVIINKNPQKVEEIEW